MNRLAKSFLAFLCIIGTAQTPEPPKAPGLKASPPPASRTETTVIAVETDLVESDPRNHRVTTQHDGMAPPYLVLCDYIGARDSDPSRRTFFTDPSSSIGEVPYSTKSSDIRLRYETRSGLTGIVPAFYTAGPYAEWTARVPTMESLRKLEMLGKDDEVLDSFQAGPPVDAISLTATLGAKGDVMLGPFPPGAEVHVCEVPVQTPAIKRVERGQEFLEPVFGMALPPSATRRDAATGATFLTFEERTIHGIRELSVEVRMGVNDHRYIFARTRKGWELQPGVFRFLYRAFMRRNIRIID